jgi:hypothetical protein
MTTKKVIPFLIDKSPEELRDTAERHARLICNIAGTRYALDFWSRASEINPVDAPVLPFSPDQPRKPKRP